MTRSEDVESEGVATESDFDVVRDSVEILDSGRKKGIRTFGVSHLRFATTRKLDALRGVLFHKSLLFARQERSGVRQYGGVLDIAVAHRSIAH